MALSRGVLIQVADDISLATTKYRRRSIFLAQDGLPIWIPWQRSSAVKKLPPPRYLLCPMNTLCRLVPNTLSLLRSHLEADALCDFSTTAYTRTLQSTLRNITNSGLVCVPRVHQIPWRWHSGWRQRCVLHFPFSQRTRGS